VGNSDTAIDEEIGETGQGEKPVEDRSTIFLVQIDECQTSEKELKQGHCEWTALLVDVGEDRWAHTICSQSLEDTCRCKSTRVGNTHD